MKLNELSPQQLLDNMQHRFTVMQEAVQAGLDPIRTSLTGHLHASARSAAVMAELLPDELRELPVFPAEPL